jgi:hypothetical protein
MFISTQSLIYPYNCSTIACVCVQKFPDWVDNEIFAYNSKHSLRSDTKGYGGKTL